MTSHRQRQRLGSSIVKASAATGKPAGKPTNHAITITIKPTNQGGKTMLRTTYQRKIDTSPASFELVDNDDNREYLDGFFMRIIQGGGIVIHNLPEQEWE